MVRRSSSGLAAEPAGPRRAARGTAVAGRLAYLDSSAFVKLPLREREDAALRRELARWDGLASSALLRVEAERACARYGPKFVARAEAALKRVALFPLVDAVLDAAATLEPPELRSLDALHLATALSLGGDLGILITYDRRLSHAAESRGLPVSAPT